MTVEQVVALMSSSKSNKDWNKNADKVVAACGGYPQFWRKEIILSGVLDSTQAKW